MSDELELPQTIAKQIKDLPWEQLVEDHQNEKLYLVDYELDFNEVALALIQDHLNQIKQWINDGLLYPPTKAEISHFESSGEYLRSIKLDHYTLIQTKTNLDL